MTARLELDVRLPRGAFTLAVREELRLQGVTALLGPSGSGKTTVLRIIAGLETDAAGRVTFDGEAWQIDNAVVPPHERRLGYVFQDGRLFPHLSVAGNLRFSRRARRGPIAFDDVVAALALEPLLERRPASLSGGEQQRAAIGRALLTAPRLLLMDEPVSALDQASRRDVLRYIETLPGKFGVPILYVTHNLDEAARLATDVWVLAAGRTAARGSTAAVLERMDLWRVTGRAEAGTVLEATVADRSGGMATLQLARQTLRVPMDAADARAALRLRIHARDVAIATRRPEALSIRNVLEAQLLRIDFDGDVHAELLLEVDGQHLRSRITREACSELGLAPGQRVYALIKSVALEDA